MVMDGHTPHKHIHNTCNSPQNHDETVVIPMTEWLSHQANSIHA